ncbi:MAG TPA: Ni/Fe-hydrogenase cytochrome b subunit [Acidobacteriota bacterium]|nr:Ni/Fe-hydrogenase cytochrome b subunit [Acidobacteriota bacterium]
MKIPKITFWRVIFVVILIAGLHSTALRFIKGLGASTALSDQFPWGLWIGFDILCGVALAAGGFTLSAVVYVFHIERFRPVIRPAILTAFLGYLLVITALLFDLGRPYRIWHALVMWNPHSVMFEVAWCVMLYTIVLALEFSPILFERLNWKMPLKIIHTITIPLVILGVILSMLHQSSLGSLYLIVPEKLYPLWYSSLLPFFFFMTSVALGCSMTILESYLSFRAFGKRLEMDLLSHLGKVCFVVLALYLVLKIQDLSGRNVLSLAFQPTYAGRMFLAEMLLGVIGPMILFSIPKIRTDVFGLFVGAVMTILGIIMNRLNVSITGIEAATGARYLPTWTEASVTTMIVASGFVLFSLAVRYLPVFPEKVVEESESKPQIQLLVVLKNPFKGGRGLSLTLGSIILAVVLLLAYSGVQLRTIKPTVTTTKVVPDIRIGQAAFQEPNEIIFPGNKDMGPVTFRHGSHVNVDSPNCISCHLEKSFVILPANRSHAPKKDWHSKQGCGSCHNGQTAFDIQEDCTYCHQ